MLSLKDFLLFLALLLFSSLTAQNYHAINGSSYAGSLAPASNPASIVHVPYAWDISPLSVQLKHSTNAIKINNLSLLSSPSNTEIVSQNGVAKRFILANQDIRLMNARINLNANAAIAFGANLRNYVSATTGSSNWQDTISSLADFMKINIGHSPLSAEISAATWAEVYATYAQTFISEPNRLVNGGITLKLNRALAGGYARAQGLSYTPLAGATAPAYLLTGGNLEYGYSANIDTLNSNISTASKRSVLLNNTYSSWSADIGVEYIWLADEDRDEWGPFAYNSKLGISLMDVGFNKFRQGSRGRLAIAGKAGVSDSLIESTFSSVGSFGDFSDSLAIVSNTVSGLSGNFVVYQPTRLLINFDQHVAHNFFINTELSIPILSLLTKKAFVLKDMNLLAITPRWELKNVGVYLPILFNNRKQLCVGAALKLGPVLLGTHNLGNLFSKNTMHTGGGYIAITIRPWGKKNKQATLPQDKLPARETRNLECPKQ